MPTSLSTPFPCSLSGWGVLLCFCLSLFLQSCGSPLPEKCPADNWKQEKFLITYCVDAPSDEPHIAAAAAENFNLVPAGEAALKFAAQHGIKVMLEDDTLNISTADSSEKLQRLDALVDRVKNDPALEGYYVFDEPQLAMFPRLETIVARIKKRDTRHFCFINLLPIFGVFTKEKCDPTVNYTNYVNQYISRFRPGLLSYDYYNFFKENSGAPKDGLIYFVHLRLLREISQKAQLPFMNIIQASNFEKDWRLPTAAQVRWQVYTSLAYGARGISYFLYWGPKKFGGLYQDCVPTPLLKTVSKLNGEIARLGPVLLNYDSTAVFQTKPLPFGAIAVPAAAEVQIDSPGEYVLGFFGHGHKSNCFMIVNRDYNKETTAAITVKGKSQIFEFDRQLGDWTKIAASSGNRFSVALQPGDGRFFRYAD